MTRVMVAAAVVGSLALLGRWWRDVRTDARLAQVDFWCGICGSYDIRACCQNETDEQWRQRFLVPLMADYSRSFQRRN